MFAKLVLVENTQTKHSLRYGPEHDFAEWKTGLKLQNLTVNFGFFLGAFLKKTKNILTMTHSGNSTKNLLHTFMRPNGRLNVTVHVSTKFTFLPNYGFCCNAKFMTCEIYDFCS